MASNRSTVHGSDLDTVAGNGLLHRRMFLTAGTAAAAAVAGAALPDLAVAAGLPVEPWMKRRERDSPLRPTVQIRKQGARTFASLPGHHRDRHVAHAASFAQRHDYA